MSQVFTQPFHDNRVFRCEPSHRPVRGKSVTGLLPSVAFKLHGDFVISRHVTETPADSREQGIVDIRIQLTKVRMKEAVSVLFA